MIGIAKQRREEQLALDQFRRLSGLLPGNDSRGADPPDFIVTRGVHRTSVETTAFHKGSKDKGGSKEAADESIAQQLTERAQTIFEAAHPNVHIEVRPFVVRGRIDRRDLYRHAELFAVAVADGVPPLPEEGQPPTRVDLAWDDMPEELAIVMAHVSVARWRPERWKPEQSSAWLLGSVGYAAIDTGELLAIIRRKELDLPRYRDEFDACWLLIYGLWQASAFFDFDYLKPHMFTSIFDGVVFVDAGTGRNVQIARASFTPRVTAEARPSQRSISYTAPARGRLPFRHMQKGGGRQTSRRLPTRRADRAERGVVAQVDS